MVEMMNAIINMDKMYEEGKKLLNEHNEKMAKAQKDFEEGKLPFQTKGSDSPNTPLGN